MKNKIVLKDDCIEIILCRKKQEVARTMIDIDKLKFISKYTWYLGKENYIYTKINKKTVCISRYLLGITDSLIEADHIDGNPLNNRMYNLRPATSQQNKMNRRKRKDNTSGITGVYWKKSARKWIAQIYINKKQIQLGRFDDVEEAKRVRLEAEKEYFGEYRYQRNEQLELPFSKIENLENENLNFPTVDTAPVNPAPIL